MVNSKVCVFLKKLKIINYSNQEELFNKSSKLISKCYHLNKNLLSNYKSNDQSFSKILTEYY